MPVGQLLEAPADAGHLLRAVGFPGLRLHQLEIVDVHDLVPPGQGVRLDVLDAHAAGLDQLQLVGPDPVGAGGKAAPLLLRDPVALDGGHLDPRQVGDQAVGQLVLVGLQAVKPDPPCLGLVIGHSHRQSGLARGGVAPQHHHVPHLGVCTRVQLGQTPGHVLHWSPAVPVGKGQEHLGHIHPPDAPAVHQQFVELGNVAPGLVHILGHLEQTAQLSHFGHPCLLPHERGVLPDVGRRGGELHELHEVLGPPVALPAPQPAPDGHRVGGLALGKQRLNGLEHHAALGGKEVLGADPLQGLPHQPGLNEQGAQHRHLGGEPVLLLGYHVATSSRATRVGWEGSDRRPPPCRRGKTDFQLLVTDWRIPR